MKTKLMIVLVLIATFFGGCGGSSEAPAQSQQQEAEEGWFWGEAAAEQAEYLCQDGGGVQSVALQGEGYLELVVCEDGTVKAP